MKLKEVWGNGGVTFMSWWRHLLEVEFDHDAEVQQKDKNHPKRYHN